MVRYKIEELDFLFIYEHKVRELENLCLLKYELDRRGYRTKIIHIENAEALKAMRPIYHTRVVVTMACYQNSSIEWGNHQHQSCAAGLAGLGKGC